MSILLILLSSGLGCHTEVVGSNPSNDGKIACAHIRAKKIPRLIFILIFIHTANIYFSTQKNDARHLYVDIGDGLKIP